MFQHLLGAEERFAKLGQPAQFITPTRAVPAWAFGPTALTVGAAKRTIIRRD
jgi:hypothetical protein